MYDAGTAALQITVSFRGIQREIRKQAEIIAKELESAVERGLKEGYQGGDATKEGAEQGDKFGDAFALIVKKRIALALKTLPDAKIDADTSEAETKLAAIRGDLKELSGKRIGIDINREEVEAQLKQIERELDRLKREAPTVTVSAKIAKAMKQLELIRTQAEKIDKLNPDIKVKADPKPAERSFSRVLVFAEETKRRIETALKTIPAVNLKADSSNVDRNLAHIRKELTELSGKTIGVDIDEDEAIKKIHDLNIRLDRISKASPSIRVAADTAAASAQLTKIEQQVTKLGRSNPTIRASVSDARAKAEMDLLALKADKLGRKRETIHVGVDEPNLRRSRGLLGSFGEGVAGIFSSLSRVVTSVGGLFGDAAQQAMQAGKGMQDMGTQAAGMASQVGGAGGGAGGAVGAVLQFTIQLYKMGGIIVGVQALAGALTIAIGGLETALAALPGIIFGAASAIGVLVIAFKNVGKAIGDGWGGNAKQFKKDLKNLTPQAQHFAEAIVGLKKPLKKLEDIVAKNFFGPFAKDIKPLANKLIPGLAKGLGYVAKSLGEGIDALLKWLNQMPQVMLITQLLGGMSGVFDKLMKSMIPFMDGFLRLVDASLPFLNNMADLITKVADSFDRWTQDPKNMKTLQDAFGNLLLLIQGTFDLLGQLLPIFLKVFADKKTRQAIQDMFTTLTQFVQMLAPLLPKLVEVFDNVMLALQVAMPMIGAFLNLLIDFTNQVLVAWMIVTVYLMRTSKTVASWFAGPFVNFFKTIGHWFAGPFVNFFKNAWSKIQSWTGTLVGKVKSLWNGMKDRVVAIWHGFYDHVIVPIRDFFTKKIPGWTGTLAGKIKSLWGGIVGRVKELWRDYLNHVVYPIRDFFTKRVPGWTGTLVGKVKSLWNGMKNRVVTIWHSFHDNVISPIKDFFTKKIPGWTGTLVGKVKDLWKDMGSATKTIWKRMKDYVKGPVKGILGIAKSMFQAVQKIADKFKIPGVPGMAKSAVSTLDSWRGKVDKWATGGPIHGAGTGTSDSIPAYLSNNEHVWTAKEVRAVGGHSRMMMLRQAALRGDIYPAYADGGPVTHIGAPHFALGGPSGGGGSNFVPNLITAIARKFQNGVRMTSGYRAFQTEGHADYHNAGLAADLVSGNMDRLAASFYKVPSYLLEEIHTRAHSNTGWYVKNGKRVSNTFYGANVPLHRDHVHIAMSRASAESLYGKLSGKHGASLLDEIKAFAGSLAGGPLSLFDWATDIYDKYFKKYVTQITDFGKGKHGALGDIGSGVMKKLADGAMDAIKPKFADVLGALDGGTGYAKGIPTKGTLSSWIRQAMKLTHVDGKPGWFNKLYSIAMRESRGDPRAVNDYDINAKIGDPTKGVMQIRSSYIKKFHQPGTSYNLFDPIANISAAINYIKYRYGTPFNTPATYYDNGGVLQPGFTPVVNHTGRDEYVFRNDQVQHLAHQGAALAARQIAAMTAAGRGGPGLVVNAKELNLDKVDYQRLNAKIDRQRVLDGLLVP